MNSGGRVLLGLGLLGAAGYGLLQLLPKTFDLNAARTMALNWTNEFVRIQRQAGFIIDIFGVADAREWFGPPPSMPQTTWLSIEGALTSGDPALFYVQVNIRYTPANAGGGEIIIIVLEKANAHFVTVFQQNIELSSWFQPLGP